MFKLLVLATQPVHLLGRIVRLLSTLLATFLDRDVVAVALLSVLVVVCCHHTTATVGGRVTAASCIRPCSRFRRHPARRIEIFRLWANKRFLLRRFMKRHKSLNSRLQRETLSETHTKTALTTFVSASINISIVYGAGNKHLYLRGGRPKPPSTEANPECPNVHPRYNQRLWKPLWGSCDWEP